jgi:homoserine dehydrogenase
MTQKVFVLGATGNVGRPLVRQMVENSDCDAARHPNPTQIDGLAASPINGRIYCEDGIRPRVALDFSERRMPGLRYDRLTDLLRPSWKETTYIDVTNAKEEALEFHMRVIKDGHSIVAANKLPLTICTFEEFNKLTNDYRRYRFSCSVMAGAGAIPFLRDCQDLNDPIIKIQGCLSGTLTYIPNQMENGMKFSDIVREARGRYTEPHPADDLDGGDVRRKSLILARTGGLDVRKEDMRVTPFIPQEYLGERDIEKFLPSLKPLDPVFEEQTREMAKQGKVLRYITTITNDPVVGRPQIVAGPEFVDKTSPFGALEGTKNMIIIWTRDHSEGYPVGPVYGAGNERTASNIRRDLLGNISGRKARAEKPPAANG